MKNRVTKERFTRFMLLPIFLFLVMLHSDLSYASPVDFNIITTDNPSFSNMADTLSDYLENAEDLGFQPTLHTQTGNSEAAVLAIASGNETFQEMVAILPSEHDVSELVKRNIVSDGWKSQFPYEGTPFTSTVVFMTSDENIVLEDWDDLLAEDVSIVMADPRRSSESQWIVLAAYKWAEIQFDGDMEQIKAFLRELFSKVKVVAFSGKSAIETFRSRQEGVNVILLWESDALSLQGNSGGEKKDRRIIYPSVTVRTEPKAVYHARAEGALAGRCMSELFSPTMQESAAMRNFRPSNEEILQKYSDKFNAGMQQYSISDFGGWAEAFAKFFAEGALFDQLGFPLVGGLTMDENAVELGRARPGDVVYFGECEQDLVISDGFEPIKWEVLDVIGDRALLLSVKNLDGKEFDDGDNLWYGSTLRDWLQNTFFYSSFTEEEQSHIVVYHNQAETSPGGDTSGESDDAVGILSISEAEQYKADAACNTAYANIMLTGRLSDSTNTACYSNESPRSEVWLRTPGDSVVSEEFGYTSFFESYIEKSGNIQAEGAYLFTLYGVRPVIWVVNEPVAPDSEEAPAGGEVPVSEGAEDPGEGNADLQLAAEAGDTGAMLELGRSYLDGTGVSIDPEAALNWFAKAIEAGGQSLDETYRNKAIQGTLNSLGYECGTVDGVAGEKTRNAVRSFRRDHGMEESDLIDLELMKKMLEAAGD